MNRDSIISITRALPFGTSIEQLSSLACIGVTETREEVFRLAEAGLVNIIAGRVYGVKTPQDEFNDQ